MKDLVSVKTELMRAKPLNRCNRVSSMSQSRRAAKVLEEEDISIVMAGLSC